METLKEAEVELRGGPHQMLGGMRKIMEDQRKEELKVRSMLVLIGPSWEYSHASCA